MNFIIKAAKSKQDTAKVQESFNLWHLFIISIKWDLPCRGIRIHRLTKGLSFTGVCDGSSTSVSLQHSTHVKQKSHFKIGRMCSIISMLKFKDCQ